MSDPTDSYELYEVPAWFQDKLTDLGGVNPFDEPNFRCVWGQGGQPEGLYRAGGHWHVEGQPSFVGYRDLLLGGGTPSWSRGYLGWSDAPVSPLSQENIPGTEPIMPGPRIGPGAPFTMELSPSFHFPFEPDAWVRRWEA